MTQEKAVREIMQLLDFFHTPERVEILSTVVDKSPFTIRPVLHSKLAEGTNCVELIGQKNAIFEIAGK